VLKKEVKQLKKTVEDSKVYWHEIGIEQGRREVVAQLRTILRIQDPE
jgi:hypothetical protein